MGNYHNIASMLTESAHAKLATPMYIHRSQLKGEDDRKQLLDEGGNTLRAFPHYKPQTNFPHPWEGGWWRVRDIVEQQKISAWGLLDMAARNKDTISAKCVSEGETTDRTWCFRHTCCIPDPSRSTRSADCHKDD